MSKRNSNSRNMGPIGRRKMPKLDISIEKPSTSKKYSTSSSNSADKFKSAIKQPEPIIDLLLDDNDQDLLFASQIVELDNKINKCYDTTEAQPTYDHFNHMLSSSTQIEKFNLPGTTDLFDEDSCDFQIDDDLLNVIKDDDLNKQNNNFKKPKSPDPNTFETRLTEINYLIDDSRSPSISSKYISKGVLKPFLKNNDNDAIQVDKLIESLDELTKDNKKQNHQINELNEKLLTKEGEVTVLRFEQRQLKQEIDALRIKTFGDTEVLKNDWQIVCQNLQRTLKEKSMELNIKKNEVCQLKQRGDKITGIKQSFNIPMLYRLNCRKLSKESTDNKNEHHIDLWVDIFQKSHRDFTYLGIFYQKELDKICNILAKIKFNPITIDDSISTNLNFEIILESTTKSINLYSIKQLNISKFCTLTNIENNKICCFNKNNFNSNICQPKELYFNERMISLRRYISGIGLIFQSLTNTNFVSIKESINQNEKLKITLEKLIELFKGHFGVLESIAFLFTSFAKINIIKPYLDLLKLLVFNQPNARILNEISKCLHIISTNNDIDVLNLLCQKSYGYLCVLNDTAKKIRVKRNTSCILQIYGLILESTYNQKKSLNEIEWKILQETCSNHSEFLRNCFERNPHFIATNSTTKCFCYVQICTSFVVLFHLYLKHCIENLKNMRKENLRRICKLGSLLIFYIFCTNYKKCVLQRGGTGIKQRLYIICETLIEHSSNIGLSKEYHIAIQRLRSSSIFADSNLNNEDSLPLDQEKGNIILSKNFEPNSFIL